MTEDKHMQKAREIVAGWRGRKGIVPWEDVETDIATALSEAYRSGVEAGMAQCEKIATDEAERWERMRANGEQPLIEPAARMLAAGTIARLIHDRLAAIRKP